MPRATLNKNLLMKHRNTNVAIMVLWQGKNGEPGLDVSNLHSKHPPIIRDTFNGLHHQGTPRIQNILSVHVLCMYKHIYAHHIYVCIYKIIVHIDSNIKYTSICTK